MNAPWHDILHAAKKRDASFKRVRVIDVPMTDYVCFECSQFKLNISFGEEVLYISKESFDALDISLTSDVCIFDNSAYKLNYTSKGEFLGFQEIEFSSALISDSIRLLEHACPLDEFLKGIKNK